jgi:hypothetical protein
MLVRVVATVAAKPMITKQKRLPHMHQWVGDSSFPPRFVPPPWLVLRRPTRYRLHGLLAAMSIGQIDGKIN